MGEQTSIVGVLRQRAEEAPARRAFTFLENGEKASSHLTYGDIDQSSRRVAALILEHTRPGGRVVLLYPPGLDFITGFFGCLYAGVVPVPLYAPRPNRADDRVRSIVADCRPSLGLTTAHVARQLCSLSLDAGSGPLAVLGTDQIKAGMEIQAPLLLSADDVAFVQYTSGSTSSPRGVMVSHGNLIANQKMIGRAMQLSESSVLVSWLPTFHDMGLIGDTLSPIYLGYPCYKMPPVAFLQHPRRWLQAVSDYRATIMGGPNFAYDLCVRKIKEEHQKEWDLSTLAVAYCGSEPIRAESVRLFLEKFRKQGLRERSFFPCYGLAEATLYVSGGFFDSPGRTVRVDAAGFESGECYPPREGERSLELVSCGAPADGIDLKIVDPRSGEALRDGWVGEVWAAGPNVVRGYSNHPGGLEQCQLTPPEKQPGSPWLRTGDLGFLRDGRLYIAGRLKDVMIFRGRNVHPQDVEQAACRSMPELHALNAAAFSVTVDQTEELVVVQEIPRHTPPGSFDGICDEIRQAIARQYEVRAGDIVLVRPGSIPVTSSGKLRRHSCRLLYLNGGLQRMGGTHAPLGDPFVGPAVGVPHAGS